jgi:hypothetical protein
VTGMRFQESNRKQHSNKEWRPGNIAQLQNPGLIPSTMKIKKKKKDRWK